MQFGCCCSVEMSEAARIAGFDFIECTVRSLEPESDNFTPILEQYRAAALPVRAFNVFLPGDLKVTGPDIDWDRVARYVTEALQRVHTIGADIVVFGSGGARNVPDDYDFTAAERQLQRFLQLTGEIAQKYGITIAIEPLNRRESNVINTVPAGVALARTVDLPSVRVLADLYHMQLDDEPLTNVTEQGPWLSHVHVADSERYAPGTGDYPYAEFFRRLHEVGYDGLISVECKWRDFEAEAPAAVQFLRQQWSAAGS